MNRILLLAAVVVLAACPSGGQPPFPSVPLKSTELTGSGIEPVWANTPPPGFTVLHRRNVYTPAPGSDDEATIHIEEFRLVEAAGWRSVVSSEERFVRAGGPPIVSPLTYFVGPPDLFPAVIFNDLSTVEPYRNFFRVVRVRDVEGELFPLAVGKRLRLTVEMDRWRESDHRRLVLREDFTVVGTTDRWARPPTSVPGPVFVIRHVMDGDLGHQEVEWHYSVTLGAGVYEREDLATRDEGESGIREVTLTDWQ
jgi:hypothetical protein